jgi:hypothetical protein
MSEFGPYKYRHYHFSFFQKRQISYPLFGLPLLSTKEIDGGLLKMLLIWVQKQQLTFLLQAKHYHDQ